MLYSQREIEIESYYYNNLDVMETYEICTLQSSSFFYKFSQRSSGFRFYKFYFINYINYNTKAVTI